MWPHFFYHAPLTLFSFLHRFLVNVPHVCHGGDFHLIRRPNHRLDRCCILLSNICCKHGGDPGMAFTALCIRVTVLSFGLLDVLMSTLLLVLVYFIVLAPG